MCSMRVLPSQVQCWIQKQLVTACNQQEYQILPASVLDIEKLLVPGCWELQDQPRPSVLHVQLRAGDTGPGAVLLFWQFRPTVQSIKKKKGLEAHQKSPRVEIGKGYMEVMDPLAQLTGGGRGVWMRCSSARTKPGGHGHPQPIPLLLMHTPKLGLAKAFSQVTSMLLGTNGVIALGYVSLRVQDLQEGGDLWCSSGDAAHCQPSSWASAHQKQDGPGALGCVLKVSVSSKVPGHFVGTEKLIPSSI
ncbi:uncharacterized protein LOC126638848 [Myiozetetes cayanensis]|uniref:uncharacterized protein LOC126638848 n=1 Tax=Myiozetetes cayanensis TaxID=478635 RepID=UPI00215E702D|nr:uncharacterized protein LOC126638848 [Myiozetetes cayanensis]